MTGQARGGLERRAIDELARRQDLSPAEAVEAWPTVDADTRARCLAAARTQTRMEAAERDRMVRPHELVDRSR